MQDAGEGSVEEALEAEVDEFGLQVWQDGSILNCHLCNRGSK
jgi:hypothetical protein